jgi:hypothetical protein
MPHRSRAILGRVRRASRTDGPYLLVICGNPEAIKRGDLVSNREALIEDDHYAAIEGETTKDFHRRLRVAARERGVQIIELGDPSNAARRELHVRQVGAAGRARAHMLAEMPSAHPVAIVSGGTRPRCDRPACLGRA